nr:hypothetical protein [Candidatus Aenigmarchaeota archaeon]
MTTRKLGFKALLEAVYDRWGNHALTSSYRIYNIGNVPDAPTWPYVAFGSPFGRESTRFKTRDTEGEENGFKADVWSDYRGDE